MWEQLQIIAEKSVNSQLYLCGMSLIYITGIILLAAVLLKFRQYQKHPQATDLTITHFFSTREMVLCVLVLFIFWNKSIGQFPLTDSIEQYVFFAIGAFGVIFGLIWHLKAKADIGLLWSDGIEIKNRHQLQTTGAYALARHPMYASLLMWCWGASLLMFNWITLGLVCAVFLPLMIIRARDEEKQLIKKNPDYELYRQNVRMLTVTTSGFCSLAVRVILVGILLYFLVAHKITLSAVVFLSFLHLYFGYAFMPEKVAFSYRSKSGMLLIFGLLGLYVWPPFLYFYYVIAAMCLYGLKWNCPCMWVYEKYHRCPCFVLLQKCAGKCKIK